MSLFRSAASSILALFLVAAAHTLAQPVLVLPESSTGGISKAQLGVTVAEALTAASTSARVLNAVLNVRAGTYSDTLERERSALAGQAQLGGYTHILLVQGAQEQRLGSVSAFGQTRVAVRVSVVFALLDKDARLIERFDLAENGQGSSVPEANRAAITAISAAAAQRVKDRISAP